MNKLSQIKSLDGVRAIAALSILWLHFWSGAKGSNINEILRSTASIGQLGVPLFFVLSGFLITRILISRKQENDYFRNFYFKRALRIFPLYYFFLLLCFYLYPSLNGTRVISFSATWPNWIYLQNIFISFGWSYEGPNHLWSLAVEEHFYLLWPVVVFFLNLKQLKRLCIAILIIEPLVRYLLLQRSIDVFYFSFTRFDELAMGALVAIMEFGKKRISRRFIVISCVAAFVLLIIFFGGWAQSSMWLQVFKYSFFAVIFYLLVSLVAFRQAKFLEPFLSAPVLRYTGRISYGLYIYHPFCYMLVYTYLKMENTFVEFVVCVLLSFLVATVSYYGFERHFLKYKSMVDKDGRRKVADKVVSLNLPEIVGNNKL